MRVVNSAKLRGAAWVEGGCEGGFLERSRNGMVGGLGGGDFVGSAG